MVYTTLEVRTKGTGSKILIEKPLGQLELTPKYSMGDFSGSGVINQFIGRNNLVAQIAPTYSLDLGGNYERFYELGLRFAQQLNGRLRERTGEEYENLWNNIAERLLDAVIAAKTAELNSDLEAMVKDDLTNTDISPGNRERIRTIADKLKSVPLAQSQGIPKDYEFLDVEDKIRILSSVRINDELIENYTQIGPQLRADYLEITTFRQFNDKTSKMPVERGSILRGMVEDLEVHNGLIFVQSLLAEMKVWTSLPPNERSYLYSFVNYVAMDTLRLKSKAEENLYFRAMDLSRGFSSIRARTGIAHAVKKLFERLDDGQAERIVNESFAIGTDSDGDSVLLSIMSHSQI